MLDTSQSILICHHLLHTGRHMSLRTVVMTVKCILSYRIVITSPLSLKHVRLFIQLIHERYLFCCYYMLDISTSISICRHFLYICRDQNLRTIMMRAQCIFSHLMVIISSPPYKPLIFSPS